MVETAFGGIIAFAASAGVATFFAPCAFPLLPGYIGYYLSVSDTNSKMIFPAAAAAGGALGSLSLIAALVLAIGQPIKQLLPVFEPVIGFGLIVFGGLTLFNKGPNIHIRFPERPATASGFGVFGAVYAVAAAGCVVPLFLGVLSQALTHTPIRGGIILVVYALGITGPLVGVTLLAGVGIDSWRSIDGYSKQIHSLAAVLMILAGSGQIYLAVFELNIQ
jgi:cytochrome c-type biogenesis protein